MSDLDQQRRINCPRCGDTRGRLFIKKVRGGFLRYCHNENCYREDSFLKLEQDSPSEILKYANLAIAFTTENSCTLNSTSKITLPYDATTKLSTESILWLDKYEILISEIVENNIVYSPHMNRLILPVYSKDRELLYYQGRNLGKITKENPKYLNLRNKNAKDVYYRRYTSETNTVSSSICIVEDILSAIKIGRHIDSLALLGSYFPKDIYLCLKEYKTIFIWLDADKYKTSIKEVTRLKLFTGANIKLVYTPLDPKEYSDKKIKEFLK